MGKDKSSLTSGKSQSIGTPDMEISIYSYISDNSHLALKTHSIPFSTLLSALRYYVDYTKNHSGPI